MAAALLTKLTGVKNIRKMNIEAESKLTEEITDLIHAIQDLDAAVKKATEIREAHTLT